MCLPSATWALAFDKQPHFPEEDTEGQREQVMHLRPLGLLVAEAGFEPGSGPIHWSHSWWFIFLQGDSPSPRPRRLSAKMASAGDPPTGPRDAADQNFDYMFKLLLIGNSSVGKTSFLFRYADDSFTPAFVSTVGIDFKVKTVYRHDKRIKLQIWVGQAAMVDLWQGRGALEGLGFLQGSP